MTTPDRTGYTVVQVGMSGDEAIYAVTRAADKISLGSYTSSTVDSVIAADRNLLVGYTIATTYGVTRVSDGTHIGDYTSLASAQTAITADHRDQTA